MTEEETYKLYQALRLHFTSPRYDITKTLGKVRTKVESLEKNPRLKQYLRKYRKEYPDRSQFIPFLVANFVYGNDYGNVYEGDPDATYRMMDAKHQQLSYRFSNDMQWILQTHGKRPEAHEGRSLMQWVMQGKIALESATILHKWYGYCDLPSSDPLWEKWSMKVRRYAPFVRTDKNKIANILHTTFGDRPPGDT